MKEVIVTTNDLIILNYLNANNGLRRKELEGKGLLEKNSMHQSITRLTTQGFIRVKEVDTHGRPHILYITKKGRTVLRLVDE